MGTDSGATARIDRLRVMYQEQFREQFDANEFLSDDFYAFQVLERSFQVGAKNRELHNLAILMHAERKALMETGQRQALEAMRNSSQLSTLSGNSSLPPREGVSSILPATFPPGALPPAMLARANSAAGLSTLPASVPAALRPIGKPLAGMPRPERRTGNVRLSAQEINALSGLRRLYHKHFGESFDVEEFASNDLYAKIVLTEAVSSGLEELKALAQPFLDKNGKPRLHRRQGRVDVELEQRARQ
jgi:hypothetical protein